ncbi:hypothetical protein BDY24DRAFT_204362 [Mrakia frigida]|uniref:NAP domain-containing protein n=1 Tax=Mrakia frigida TaxID=29902 RepID=UPI003FCBF74C
MTSSQAIPSSGNAAAPTPVNSLASPAELVRGSVKPSVAQIGEEDEGANPASMLANNPNLFGLDAFEGHSSSFIASLPAQVRTRVEGLKGIQVEHSKIESEFALEILALEKKFAQRYAPLYERRKAIVNGAVEPTEEEVSAGEAVDEDEESEATIGEVDEDDKTKGIPDFWLVALRNHVGISELITEQDEDALHSLTDIKLSYIEGTTPGFKITFAFSENEFFTNAELEKTYYYRSEVGYGGDLMYERAEGTVISWKEEKDLTKRTEIKKQRNKTTNRTRVVKKVIPADSFFNFFSPPTPPTEEALEDGTFEEEDLAALDERLELDYQIGEDLKEKVIPRAVDFFTGKALQFDDLDDEDDEFDDDDEFDEDDDEDDFASRQANAAPGTSQDPQECKQQ